MNNGGLQKPRGAITDSSETLRSGDVSTRYWGRSLWLKLWIKAFCTLVICSVYANVLSRQVIRCK